MHGAFVVGEATYLFEIKPTGSDLQQPDKDSPVSHRTLIVRCSVIADFCIMIYHGRTVDRRCSVSCGNLVLIEHALLPGLH